MGIWGGIWRNINPIYTIVLILSVTFVIVPCAFTILQLILHSRKHWFDSSDKVRGWLASRSNMLYFASIITGSSFTAVSLCNKHLNIPQLALQSYFIYSLGGLDGLITLSSIVFSLLSIIVSILSMHMFTQRSISRVQGTVSISMAVTGSAVLKKRIWILN
eukprot:896061_1